MINFSQRDKHVKTNYFLRSIAHFLHSPFSSLFLYDSYPLPHFPSPSDPPLSVSPLYFNLKRRAWLNECININIVCFAMNIKNSYKHEIIRFVQKHLWYQEQIIKYRIILQVVCWFYFDKEFYYVWIWPWKKKFLSTNAVMCNWQNDTTTDKGTNGRTR